MSISPRGIRFGFGVQSTNRTTGVAASAGLRIRREGSIPKFKAGMEPAELPSMDGSWGARDHEEVAGNRNPVFPYPGYLTPGLLKLGLDQVMDGTLSVSQWDYVLMSGTDFIPPATSYLSLWRRNEKVSSQDERLIGAAIKSLKISSSYSQKRVNLDYEFIAYDFEDGQDGSAGTYTLPSENVLLHSGLTMELDSVAKQCPEFDILIDFGLTPVLDNSDKSQENILGELKVEGTVYMPFANDDEQADYLGSTAVILGLRWGTAASSGYTELTVPVKFTEPEQDEAEARIRQGLPFHLAETDGQALAISLQV